MDDFLGKRRILEQMMSTDIYPWIFSPLERCFFCSFLIFKYVLIVQNSNITLKYRSKYGAIRARNISLRLSSREQTNGSTSINNKMTIDSLIMRFSIHFNLLSFSI